MKSLALIFLTTSLPFSAAGQSLSGKKQFGGHLNAYYSSQDNMYPTSPNSLIVGSQLSSTNLSLSPQYGFFASDKISFGAQVSLNANVSYQNYNIGGQSSPVTTKVLVSSFLAGPYMRLHRNVGEQFYFFAQAEILAGSGARKHAFTDEPVDESFFHYKAGIRPGVTFFLNDNFAIEAMFGFVGQSGETSKLKGSSGAQKNTKGEYGIDLGLSSLSFGVQYYF